VARGHAARMQIAGNYWDVLRIASSRTG